MNIGWLRSKRVWLFVAVVVGFIGLLKRLPLESWLPRIQNWLQALGPGTLPMFLGIYVIVTVLCLPNAILMLAAGPLFGLWKGVLFVSLADIVGASACFLLGRTVARKPIKKWISRRPDFVHLDHAIGRKGWKILLLTRLSPLLPSNLLNYGFSCTKVKFWDYVICSWLGMLPIITLYVYIGSFGARIASKGTGNWALQLGGLVATVGVAVYTTRFAKATLAQAAAAQDESNKS
jgi:uncharacterized membrane protein YdjX (TVP38/TMEM64 family)